jgi:Spy/CpxP family protein refolding chaperone
MAETREPARPVRGTLPILGVFALGIVFGAALVLVLSHLHGPHRPGPHGEPEGGMPPRIERMFRELDLDPAQEQKVREILERSHGRIHETLDHAHEEIRALLRPEQQRKFDRMRPPHGRGGDEPPPP